MKAAGMGNSAILRWLAIAAIVVTGVIHLVEMPEYFKDATYLGVLFLLNGIGALVAAVGIFRDEFSWGWTLGLLVAGGAGVMYIISRTVGLPGLDEKDWGGMGILSLVVEGIFVVLYGLRASQHSAVAA